MANMIHTTISSVFVFVMPNKEMGLTQPEHTFDRSNLEANPSLT